jgi:hypothetical protein
LRKNLFAVILAVFCGILVMVIPLCVWHQVSFPNKAVTFLSLRKEALESVEAYGTPLANISLTPFYVAFIVSLAVSLVVYLFSKKRV